ncbi:MarR family winged helix-turn-helix transcriptional regulator [Gimesia chilikensis]|jgi:DNA-binding MarR family transcriptional regulator|uniref:MarR family winged helix-turn-helix transcriptional regulator n=1 Tax=Gimesia chilikensis TaxID=2605989 RepID=UPI000C566357|nr:MarR family transcriptional regulator [Gimesia chilikensis]MBN73784.1 MarR family transcriptional regulator [Gimesia sp.]
MAQDLIDVLIRQWKTERPDLNVEPMGVVGRVLRLATRLERRVSETLKPYGLTVGGFDILATLRRTGNPQGLTPTELMEAVMLSSGAMTNRIDRLEEQGLVERRPSPNDRRSLQVLLTAEGRKVVDKAVADRLDEAEGALCGLKAEERDQLADLLRAMLQGLND